METKSEIWRKCHAPYLRYEVSNMGRVRNAHTGCMLKPYFNQNGYLALKLYWKGEAKYCRLHRLVALAFCEGYQEGLEVNHRNGNKEDCRACNLEWVTRSENMQHRSNVLLIEVQPVALFRNQRLSRIFPSYRAAGRSLGVNKELIRQALKRGSRILGYTPILMSKQQYRDIINLANVQHYTLHSAYIESLTPCPSPTGEGRSSQRNLGDGSNSSNIGADSLPLGRGWG